MDEVEFDRFADQYYEQHREDVAVTEQRPEYFAIADMRFRLGNWQLDPVLSGALSC